MSGNMMSQADSGERPAAFDLDAYCRRIGYGGARSPTLATLREIHRLHPQAIPFESLDVLLRRPVRIEAEPLQEKMVRGGRGGYCFEQNSLLSLALRAFGFAVSELTGRVRYGVPDGVPTPLTHMLLIVDLDRTRYLADVGFGANTITGPLLLESRAEQATPHEPCRVTEADGKLAVQAKIRDLWTPLYTFNLEPQHPPDIELGNWYMATSPNSRFFNDLIVTRAESGRRLALSNNRLTIHSRNGTSERRVLETPSEMRDVLTGLFGLTLPDDPGLEAALIRYTVGAI